MLAMIYERDVREKIAAVLANEISIGDFARWIMSNSWNMHKDSSDDAIALVSDVHLLLAERDDFSLNDDEFVSGLSALVAAQPHQLLRAESAGVPVRLALCFEPQPCNEIMDDGWHKSVMPTRRRLHSLALAEC
jgi:hypothetical protein